MSQWKDTGNRVGRAAGVADTCPPFTGEQRRCLMLYLMTCEQVYLHARGIKLEAGHFIDVDQDCDDVLYGIVWAAYCSLRDQYGERPHPDVLYTVAVAECSACPDVVGPDPGGRLQRDSLIGMYSSLQDGSLDKHVDYGLDLLRLFLVDRMVARPLQRETSHLGRNIWTSPLKVMDRYSSVLQVIDGLRRNESHGLVHVAKDGEQKRYEEGKLFPTGVKYYNKALGGGMASGLIYGLLGPFGGFKTGGLVQLSVAQAKLQYAARLEGREHGLVVYASYEENKHLIRFRALANAARIPRAHIRDYFSGRYSLSKEDTLQNYEREHNFTPQGETARLSKAVDECALFRILDMSGSSESPRAGNGYVEELAAALTRTREEMGMEIKMVCIDYAKRMAKKSVAAGGGRMQDELRHRVGDLPDTARRLIAEPFKCAVWIANQLNASANRKAPGAVQTHADSAEAADFGENCTFCFTHSNVDPVNKCLAWMASKTRDTEGIPTPIIMRIDGYRSALVPSEEYVYNPSLRRIVDKESFESVNGKAPGADDNQEADSLNVNDGVCPE